MRDMRDTGHWLSSIYLEYDLMLFLLQSVRQTASNVLLEDLTNAILASVLKRRSTTQTA